jgi:RNA polymerase sigma-70 factor (ECF subfamily)
LVVGEKNGQSPTLFDPKLRHERIPVQAVFSPAFVVDRKKTRAHQENPHLARPIAETSRAGETMDPESDEELVQRANRGDRSALEQLFRRHYTTMHKFAQKICGDPMLAEDVTHDAIVKLMGSISTYDHKCAFTSWLYRVVLTKAIDHRRKAQRRHELLQNFRMTISDVEPARQETDMLARQVLDLVLELPADLRDVTLLILGEGLTHRQAAEILDCPVGTIGWRLNKALKNLNETMNANDTEPRHTRNDPQSVESETALARC